MWEVKRIMPVDINYAPAMMENHSRSVQYTLARITSTGIAT